MIPSAKWKWLVETPLSRAWRGRLELCLGVVLSSAMVVGLSSSIRPDPAKVAAMHGTPVLMSSSAPALASEPAPTPKVTPDFNAAIQDGDVGRMAKHYVRGMPLEGLLSVAARSGKTGAVRWLLDRGADPHDDEGSTYAPILLADDHPDIVSLLLSRGTAEPSLEAAAYANAPNTVLRLLAAHPKRNWQDYPLHAIAGASRGTAANQRLIVTRFLAEGADPNQAGSGSGWTPLANAVASCNTSRGDNASLAAECMTIVHLLLDHGARVTGQGLAAALTLDDDVRDAPLEALLSSRLEKGVTAVALAEAYHVYPRDLKRLAALGIDWAWQDGEMDAALPVLAAVKRGDRDAVRAFLDAGAPVDVHFKDGSSALGEAIDGSANDSDAARIVELLVTRGANVNRRLPDGRTPLFAAAESGNVRVVNFLIAHGARVNDLVLDDNALDIAEQNGHLPVARVLHAHGARRARRPF